MPSVNHTIIPAKVTLQHIEPPIWRRLLLPPPLNLAELHHVLQAAFGWRDEHLHEFIIGGLVYGAPELADRAAAEDDPKMFEATDVHLRDFDLYHVPDLQFLYHYDFGGSVTLRLPVLISMLGCAAGTSAGVKARSIDSKLASRIRQRIATPPMTGGPAVAPMRSAGMRCLRARLD